MRMLELKIKNKYKGSCISSLIDIVENITDACESIRLNLDISEDRPLREVHGYMVHTLNQAPFIQ